MKTSYDQLLSAFSSLKGQELIYQSSLILGSFLLFFALYSLGKKLESSWRGRRHLLYKKFYPQISPSFREKLRYFLSFMAVPITIILWSLFASYILWHTFVHPWVFIFKYGVIIGLILMLKNLISYFHPRVSKLLFMQKISHYFFKKQVESTVEQQGSKSHQFIPETYLCLFNEHSHMDSNLFVDSFSKLFSELNHKGEQEEFSSSLALIGARGTGKTSALKLLSQKEENTHYLRCHEKMISSQKLLKLLEPAFGKELHQGKKSILEIDKEIGPRTIILDDAHNLFLGREDGFEAFKTLIEIINLETSNFRWIASFHQHSWNYIQQIMGENEYFGKKVFMPRWESSQIIELIKKRHRHSKYQLSFQSMEKASGQKNIEEKFFNFIAEQAGGVPGQALQLWPLCLKPSSYETLEVGLPREINYSETLSPSQDNDFFIYAALLKHESLTAFEASQVTSLPKGLVEHILKKGEEKKLLQKDRKSSYQIKLRSLGPITSILSKKNFIYE